MMTLGLALGLAALLYQLGSGAGARDRRMYTHGVNHAAPLQHTDPVSGLGATTNTDIL